MTVTMCGWLSLATARASRRKRSSWSGSVEMSRCISLIATHRSRVGSKARYTVDIPPDPTFSSRRKRSLIRVPITFIYFAPFDARARPLLHRSGVRRLLWQRARAAEADDGVRRGPHFHLRDGRTCPHLRGRSRLARPRMAGRLGALRYADRPPPLARGPDPVHLPRLHGGQGGRRPSRRRRLNGP